MLKGQTVRVIGGGVAGLAVATALAQRGCDVTLHEQARAITEVGAGLQISPNGSAVLTALGLGEALHDAGVISRAVELRDFRRGARVLRLDLARRAGRYPFVLIHRARLIALLERAARDAGVRLVLNSRITSGTAPDDGLLIGADGLHSWLRQRLNGDETPFFTGQTAWRAVIADTGAPEAHVYMGPGRHLVTYPLGDGLRNIVAVEELDTWAAEGWHHTADPANLRRAFAGFAPEVRSWLDRVETVHLWGLFRHPVARRWHDDASVILGDAAHPTLPFLAQGANMALEDAWVLADCLGRHPPDRALPLYQHHRRARTVRVIDAATANARNYHLRRPFTRGPAHAALRLGSALFPGAALHRFEWLYGHDVTAP